MDYLSQSRDFEKRLLSFERRSLPNILETVLFLEKKKFLHQILLLPNLRFPTKHN